MLKVLIICSLCLAANSRYIDDEKTMRRIFLPKLIRGAVKGFVGGLVGNSESASQSFSGVSSGGGSGTSPLQNVNNGKGQEKTSQGLTQGMEQALRGTSKDVRQNIEQVLGGAAQTKVEELARKQLGIEEAAQDVETMRRIFLPKIIGGAVGGLIKGLLGKPEGTSQSFEGVSSGGGSGSAPLQNVNNGTGQELTSQGLTQGMEQGLRGENEGVKQNIDQVLGGAVQTIQEVNGSRKQLDNEGLIEEMAQWMEDGLLDLNGNVKQEINEELTEEMQGAFGTRKGLNIPEGIKLRDVFKKFLTTPTTHRSTSQSFDGITSGGGSGVSPLQNVNNGVGQGESNQDLSQGMEQGLRGWSSDVKQNISQVVDGAKQGLYRTRKGIDIPEDEQNEEEMRRIWVPSVIGNTIIGLNEKLGKAVSGLIHGVAGSKTTASQSFSGISSGGGSGSSPLQNVNNGVGQGESTQGLTQGMEQGLRGQSEGVSQDINQQLGGANQALDSYGTRKGLAIFEDDYGNTEQFSGYSSEEGSDLSPIQNVDQEYGQDEIYQDLSEGIQQILREYFDKHYYYQNIEQTDESLTQNLPNDSLRKRFDDFQGCLNR